MCALLVAGGAETNGSNGTGLHSIIMFLMSLHIGTKREANVFGVVDLVALKEVTARIVRTDTVFNRESIPPGTAFFTIWISIVRGIEWKGRSLYCERTEFLIVLT